MTICVFFSFINSAYHEMALISPRLLQAKISFYFTQLSVENTSECRIKSFMVDIIHNFMVLNPIGRFNDSSYLIGS